MNNYREFPDNDIEEGFHHWFGKKVDLLYVLPCKNNDYYSSISILNVFS